jgi:osmotically-inducible protein OsmY
MFERFESRNGGLAIEMWRAEDDVASKDGELQDEIWAQLREIPAFEGGDLEVVVHEGVAMLSGTVAAYAAKMTALRLAARVPGIRQVENAIFVLPAPPDRRSDEALLKMVTTALEWDSRVPHTRITAAVLSSHVELTGMVEHADERDAAEETVAHLIGICGVTNRIAVPVRPTRQNALTAARQSIAQALGHEATHVRIAVRDGKVELGGHVRSLAERQGAERAVWRALGDVPLENRIAVEG